MANVTVKVRKGEPIDKTIRRFETGVRQAFVIQTYLEHRSHLTKSEIRRQKRKRAQRENALRRKYFGGEK